MDRRLVLRTAALGSIIGLAGCGVASRTGVVVDGPGRPAGTSSGLSKQQPPKHEVFNDPVKLVHSLFSQACWDLIDASQAAERWFSYLPPNRKYAASAEVTVVFCDFDSMKTLRTEGDIVELSLQVTPLGKLEADGRLTPNTSDHPYELRVEVGPVLDDTKEQAKPDRPPLWVLDLWVPKSGKESDRSHKPPTLLLSSEALGIYYEYRNIYFWDKSLTCLVPDARYVPTSWEDATRLKKLVEWLLAGSQAWLRSAVDEQQPPPGVKVIGVPSPTGQRLVVNLTAEVAKANLDRLVSQLTWTLLREVGSISADAARSPITISIESIEKKVGGQYATDNATALRTSSQQAIEAFAIVGGQVERIKGQVDRRNPPPMLEPALNQNVEWAAYCRDARAEGLKAAAVVRRERGVPHLYLGPKTELSTKLVEVSRESLGHPQAMLQPAFLDSSNLLVVADGALYCVQRSASRAESLKVSGIQAFGVPPDGRRVAYIRDGGLWLGALPMVGGRVSVGQARQIRTILSDLTGVAFTAENWLAVSGTYQGKTRVVEISLDGGLVGGHSPDDQWLGGNVDRPIAAITSLTAYPDNPLDAVTTKRVYVTAGTGAAATALNATSNFDPLTAELVDAAPTGKLAVHPFFMQ
jgi:Sporulation and spore germination